MIDIEKTVITTARNTLNEIKLNSKRRDIDSTYISAINELGKIHLYMLNNFYSKSDIDNISNIINSIARINGNIKLYRYEGTL